MKRMLSYMTFGPTSVTDEELRALGDECFSNIIVCRKIAFFDKDSKLTGRDSIQPSSKPPASNVHDDNITYVDDFREARAELYRIDGKGIILLQGNREDEQGNTTFELGLCFLKNDWSPMLYERLVPQDKALKDTEIAKSFDGFVKNQANAEYVNELKLTLGKSLLKYRRTMVERTYSALVGGGIATTCYTSLNASLLSAYWPEYSERAPMKSIIIIFGAIMTFVIVGAMSGALCSSSVEEEPESNKASFCSKLSEFFSNFVGFASIIGLVASSALLITVISFINIEDTVETLPPIS